MKKPPAQTFLLGNPFVGLFSYAVAAFLIYQAFQHEGAWIAAGIAVLFAVHVTRCSKQVSAYRLWALEWDAMGVPARQPKADAPRPWARDFGGAVVGLVLIWFAFDFLAPGHDGLKIVVVGLCSAAIAGWALHNLNKRPAAATSERLDVQVSHCLPVPVQSPDASRVYGLLPGYCLRLFQRR